jgi:hypothetical protein
MRRLRAEMMPKPFQEPHPPALWRAVPYGDGFFGAGSMTTTRFAAHVAIVREPLAEAGWNPSGFRIALARLHRRRRRRRARPPAGRGRAAAAPRPLRDHEPGGGGGPRPAGRRAEGVRRTCGRWWRRARS